MHSKIIFLNTYFQELVNYTIETPYISLKCEIFSVMVALAHSVAVDKFDLSAGKVFVSFNHLLTIHYFFNILKSEFNLYTVNNEPVITKFIVLMTSFPPSDCKVLRLCQDCIFHDNVKLASTAVELLTQIAIHVFQGI